MRLSSSLASCGHNEYYTCTGHTTISCCPWTSFVLVRFFVLSPCLSHLNLPPVDCVLGVLDLDQLIHPLASPDEAPLAGASPLSRNMPSFVPRRFVVVILVARNKRSAAASAWYTVADCNYYYRLLRYDEVQIAYRPGPLLTGSCFAYRRRCRARTLPQRVTSLSNCDSACTLKVCLL